MGAARTKQKKDTAARLLERLLEDDDLDDHYAAREELAALPAEAKETILTQVIAAALDEEPPAAAIGVLADLGDPRATAALVKLCEHDDMDVREEAVTALSNLEDRPAAAVPALVAALSDPSEDIRDQAADALADYASAAAVVPLLAALAKAHEAPKWQSDVRVGGILEALAASGPTDPRVIDALTEHLVPGAPAVAKPAFDALTTLGKKARERAYPVLKALVASDPPSPASSVTEPSAVAQRWLSIHARRTLIAMGDAPTDHVPAILDALLVKDPGGVVNAAASGLLQDLGAAAKPFLEAAVKGKNVALRKVAERVKTKMASRR